MNFSRSREESIAISSRAQLTDTLMTDWPFLCTLTRSQQGERQTGAWKSNSYILISLCARRNGASAMWRRLIQFLKTKLLDGSTGCVCVFLNHTCLRSSRFCWAASVEWESSEFSAGHTSGGQTATVVAAVEKQTRTRNAVVTLEEWEWRK